MVADLDARIKISELNCLNQKNVDINVSYDEDFLEIYETILKEAKTLKDKPLNLESRTVKKKVQQKKIVLVDAIISDNDETFAGNIYYKIFGREPDKIGYENLLNKLKSEKNPDRERIVYNYWKSSEGQKKNVEVVGFKKIYMSDLLSFEGERFVEHCFLQILRRMPSKIDTQDYCNAMYKQGKSKEEIIRIIKDSDEAQKRKVEIIGFEKAYKKRKFKQSVLATPILGNLVLALWNHIHINRRLAQIDSNVAKVKGDYENRIKSLKEENLVLSEVINDKEEEIRILANLVEGMKVHIDRIVDRQDECISRINTLYNPDNATDYVERLNMLLSVRKTLWGDENRLHISKRASMSTCFFNTSSGEITVGDYSFAGSNVSILTGSHDKYLRGLLRRDVHVTEGNDIIIGSGVWLGSNSTILGPATIGDNAVVAAGAVVVPGTIIKPNTVYAGIPAKQIGNEISFIENEAESIAKALEYKNGKLFTKGWSEERGFAFEGRGVQGHFLYDTSGEVLIKSGEYTVRYGYTGEKPVKLSINNGKEIKEYNLSSKEGRIDLTVNQNVDMNDCIYIVFSIDSVRDDFALTIDNA